MGNNIIDIVLVYMFILSVFYCKLWFVLKNSGRYPHVPVDPDDLPIRPGLKPPYPYKTIGCIFNHEYFFANSQVLGLYAEYVVFSEFIYFLFFCGKICVLKMFL